MSTSGTTERAISRPLAFLLLAAGAAFFVWVMVGVASEGLGYDLIPLSVAGRLVAEDHQGSLYAQDPRFYNRVSNPVVSQVAADAGFPSEPTPFVYPPLVAFAMQAIARVPFSSVAHLWAWLSAFLFLAGLHLVGAAYAPDWTFWNRPVQWAALLLVLCAFEPIRYGFRLGQTTAIIFPLIAAALLLQRRGRPASAGFALALAAFIKLTPLVFVLVWLWRGPRRAAIWTLTFLAALWAVSLVVMGLPAHAAYLARVSAIGRTDVAAYNNHSLLAFLSRFWLDRSSWSTWQMWPPPQAAWAINWILVAGGLVIGGILLITIPRADDQRWRPLAEACAFLALLLVPNIAWTHYFVFLLPVLAAVAVARAGSPLTLTLSALAFLLCCRPVLAAQDQLPSTASLLLVSTPTVAAFVAAIAVFFSARTPSDLEVNTERQIAR